MKENTGHKQGGNILCSCMSSRICFANKEDCMIDKIIGFIGAGNMGSAMIGGIVHSELVLSLIHI